MANTLPNAPLVEVVLEVRWALLGEPLILSGPENLRTDPGYAYLVEKFAVAAKKLGYTRRSEIKTDQPIGPIGYSVQHRFHKSDDVMLPIFQIGPGIWSHNDSAGIAIGCPIQIEADSRRWYFGGPGVREPAFKHRPKHRASPSDPSHSGVEFVRAFDDYNDLRFSKRLARRTTFRLI